MTLLDAAKRVRENAHAPYSNFKVGAALRTPSGKVYAGCNVENAAYPEGTCAEAGAIAAMVAAGETEIAEIAVVGDAPAPVSPCGGCRQKIAEFAPKGVPVTMANMAGDELVEPIEALLPHAFAKAQMEG
ncbi:MAG: cytidine deaminase [Maritimibacter sp.]